MRFVPVTQETVWSIPVRMENSTLRLRGRRGPWAAALLQGEGRLYLPRPEEEHGTAAGFMKAAVTPTRFLLINNYSRLTGWRRTASCHRSVTSSNGHPPSAARTPKADTTLVKAQPERRVSFSFCNEVVIQ